MIRSLSEFAVAGWTSSVSDLAATVGQGTEGRFCQGGKHAA